MTALSATPAGRAWVWAFLSEQHAALGDDLVSGRFLEQAHNAAARVACHGPGWGWWSTHGQLADWDGLRPDVFTGVRSLELGRPTDALALYDGALAGITSPSRRAWIHEDRTHAYVALGEAEGACASAAAALDEADAHDLQSIPPRIRQARASFPTHWGTSAALVDLDERLFEVA